MSDAYMSEGKVIEREMAYTPWEWACRDSTVTGGLEDAVYWYCRRPLGHPGACASGHGTKMHRWAKTGARA